MHGWSTRHRCLQMNGEGGMKALGGERGTQAEEHSPPEGELKHGQELLPLLVVW